MNYGIICEYNPFHEGHAWQMAQVRLLAQQQNDPSSHIICMMSGNYVQRGEPAIIDKWSRAREALQCGADMVLELPTVYATAAAPDFAWGAITHLCRTQLIHILVYGIDYAFDAPLIKQLAKLLYENDSSYQDIIKKHLLSSTDFASARLTAIRSLAEETPFPLSLWQHLELPNTILALEYELALLKHKSSIQTIAIERNPQFATAGEIRHKTNPHWPDCFSPLLHTVLNNTSPDDLSQLVGCSEGLENRLMRVSNDFPEWNELVDRMKAKRYPTSRLRRLILHTLLGWTKSKAQSMNWADGAKYIRVLGISQHAKALLSSLTSMCDIPVITQINDDVLASLPPDAALMLKEEIRYTDLYFQATGQENACRGQEYKHGLMIL